MNTVKILQIWQNLGIFFLTMCFLDFALEKRTNAKNSDYTFNKLLTVSLNTELNSRQLSMNDV